MTSSKKDFDWNRGGVISSDEALPLGGVRAAGFKKTAKAVAADPELRKKERESFVIATQSQPYATRKQKTKDELLIDESHSGLSNEVEDTAARKLINTNNQKFKGIERFKK